MYPTYTALLWLGLLLASPYYLLRFRKYLPTLGERLGYIAPQPEGGCLWIHAVSVGEVGAIEQLIEKLRERFPRRQLIVSTTTPTGRGLAIERLKADRVVYFPLDLPNVVKRSLGRIRPSAVIIAETEIWPNFLRECGISGIPVFMVNGRISDKSYRRYLRMQRWLPRVLNGYRVLGMQSEMDAERIRTLGADSEKVSVFGNLKYDAPIRAQSLDDPLETILRGPRRLLVAASTAADEEGLVLDAYKRLRQTHDDLRLLIAPRLPDRFDFVSRRLDASGFSYLRRSDLKANGAKSEQNADIILLDSVGELTGVFPHATIVFMGGTLVPRGGHNLIEPAQFSKPVVFGPHMENFREMARVFLEETAAIQIADVRSLAVEIGKLLGSPEMSETIGTNARNLVDRNAGATLRAINAISETLDNRPGIETRQ